jgi:hypothetical protein
MPIGDDVDKMMFAIFKVGLFWAFPWLILAFIFGGFDLMTLHRFCRVLFAIGLGTSFVTGLAIIIRRKFIR